MVKLLLKRGADSKIIGGDNGTALVSSGESTALGIVWGWVFRALLDNGADINHPGARQSPRLGEQYLRESTKTSHSTSTEGLMSTLLIESSAPLASAFWRQGRWKEPTCLSSTRQPPHETAL